MTSRLGNGSDLSAVTPLSPDRIRRIRRRLLTWYDRSARDLPWRRPDAGVYHKWVAEIMLQQTRVETVLGYYDAFLRRFPNVEALTAARLADVLTVWQGLGYYRRAENMHRAARVVADRGCWPESLADWLALPGIGPYTAGAIASMAQGVRAAAIDGNVRRVLARLLPVDVPVASVPGAKIIQEAATRLLPIRRCGDFNQAWMDLASAICLPRNPTCPQCPLAGECAANISGSQHARPITQPKSAPLEVERLAVAFVREDRVLLVQRPPGGLWSGLWELPNRDQPQGPPLNGSGVTEFQAIAGLAADLQLPPPRAIEFLQVISHQLTHRTYHFHLYRAELLLDSHARFRRARRRWVSPSDTSQIAISSAQRKLLTALQEGLQTLTGGSRGSGKRGHLPQIGR